jgi:hypothetical protein
MPAFTMDVWFGSRILGRSPWFTAIVVLTLGLGIAVNTTVFSWINSVLLHPFLGVGDPQELALTKSEWQTRPLTLPWLGSSCIQKSAAYQPSMERAFSIQLGFASASWLGFQRHGGMEAGTVFRGKFVREKFSDSEFRGLNLHFDFRCAAALCPAWLICLLRTAQRQRI